MGVEKTIIKAGDGKTFPKKGDHLQMHYVGTFKDGKVFDSSRARNKPLHFIIGVGAVIKGWDEGVMQMSLKEKAKLEITSDYAYGSNPPDGIPPDADMNFEVELLAINDNTGSSCLIC
mmetsp:Transcript_30121/g.51484  ORF Transcript_30121/g.51484 Transcript_30121/m.51484 type:complete len:118 (-) Transcript_30121:531-884(-)